MSWTTSLENRFYFSFSLTLQSVDYKIQIRFHFSPIPFINLKLIIWWCSEHCTVGVVNINIRIYQSQWLELSIMIGLFVPLRPPQLSCQWHQGCTFDSLGDGLIFLWSQRLSFGFLDSDWRSRSYRADQNKWSDYVVIFPRFYTHLERNFVSTQCVLYWTCWWTLVPVNTKRKESAWKQARRKFKRNTQKKATITILSWSK